MPAPSLEDWIELVQRFVDGSLPGDEFDDAYFALHDQADAAHDRGESWVRDASATQVDEARSILEDFFIKVDRFTDDPAMPAEIPVSEEELRGGARRVVTELHQVATGSTPHPGRSESVLRLALMSVSIVLGAVLFAIYALWRALCWPVAHIAARRRGA